MRSTPQLDLPPELQEQFAELERRLWRVDTLVAVCGAAAGLLLSYTLVFISDRFWDTPGWLRLFFTAAGLGAVGYFLWGWLQVWVWRKRDVNALAQVVQNHFSRLGDRLLGIVELADERRRPPNVSPALCRAAIKQVSGEAVQLDFRAAVATRKPRIFLVASMVLAALVLAPALLVPSASWNAFLRWMGPGSSLQRFTFVRLDALPDRIVVAHGEPFEIVTRVQLHTFWKPSTASAQYENQKPIHARISGGQILFAIPGQTQPGDLTLRVGDVSHRTRVEPTFRPALQELQARVHYPDYLQYPPIDQAIRNATLTVVEGSQAAFQGVISRELKGAQVLMSAEESDVKVDEELRVERTEFTSRPLLLDGISKGVFSWQDIFGLTNSSPWSLTLQTRQDGAPFANCPEQAGVIAILHNEVVEIKAAAEDDFGLQQLGLEWQCRDRQETNVISQAQSVLAEGSPQATNLTAAYSFAPALLGLPEQTVVTLRAVARDYHPGRGASYSSTYRIHILGQEEHAQLVQEQFEKLLAEVEELTRRQEGLLESGRQLQGQGSEQMAGEQTEQALEDQASEQRRIADQTENLAREGSEIIREALRNPSIPTELLKEWAQQMQNMQQLSQQQMPQASQSLSKAQQNQNPEQRAEQLDQAVQTEQEILDALQELQRRLGPALDRLLANTLAQRLRRLAKVQSDVEGAIKTMLPQTIGLTSEQLPEKHARTTTHLASEQAASRVASGQVHEEIARFHQRTSVTNYGTVAREMDETKVEEALGENSELIRQNIAAQAMSQAKELGGNFTRWAEELEAAGQQEGGGEGGGQGEASEEALQRLLALLRLRQSEQNLREHTRALDRVKEGRASYLEDSTILSVRQSLLVDDLSRLQEQDPGKFLSEVDKAMGEAEGLLQRPETGDPTVAVETDVVNLLEAEIMAMVQNQSGAGQSAAMAMMMQMMGMNQAGTQGGANQSGGTTDDPSPVAKGQATGAAAGDREVEKATSRGSRSVPVEYRDVLQHYYKRFEQLNSKRPE